MRARIVLVFFVILATTGHASAQMSWEKIAESRLTGLSDIKLTDPDNRDAIIAHAYLEGPEKVANKIKKNIAGEGYSPILFELYLSVKLTEDSLDDAGIFPLLSEYISHEKDNAIPLYFMSYYYARKQNFHMSVEYLRKGNRMKQCRLYLEDKKLILFNYYLSKTNDEFTAFCSQFSLTNLYLYKALRDLVRKLENNNLVDVSKDEIRQIGIKYEPSSTNVVDKMFSLTIQMDCLNEDRDQELYDSLKSRYNYYKILPHRAYDRKGEDKLLLYLKTAFEHGEVYALEQLGTP